MPVIKLFPASGTASTVSGTASTVSGTASTVSGTASTVSHSKPANRRLKSLTRFTTLALAVIVIASACTSNESLSTEDDTSDGARDRVITDLDTDQDGVVNRTEFEYRMLIEDPDAIVGALSGINPLSDLEIPAHQVLTSLIESPPSQMEDAENPGSSAFIARLTSMLQLRLAAVSLTDLGFATDLSGSDLDINASITEVLATDFEDFAREKILDENPVIYKLTSPHCIVLLATATEQEALDASERVLAGESARDVASEVNVEGATAPDGYSDCRVPEEWINLPRAIVDDIRQIEQGELSDPSVVEFTNSPTGELYLVAVVEEIRLDEANVDSAGPFANAVLLDQMMTYDVLVAPELGTWSMDSLAVVLPVS